ncbi:hypothetical protein SLEP1_g56585 [Rubroshorea leprosula]|uniref:Uncharacterized protein n=1 Tax=Rubroshorea leprosula TaxID=152421 RepID=A0AAV5MK52_9ROSI|nr:hypothetical protein SLEP1_g56585 [Rubroshorea leprosula]
MLLEEVISKGSNPCHKGKDLSAGGLYWWWLRMVNGAMVAIAMRMVQAFWWGLCDNGMWEWWGYVWKPRWGQDTCGMIASSKEVGLWAI